MTAFYNKIFFRNSNSFLIMKKIFILLFGIALTATAYSQESSKILVIEKINNSTESIMLDALSRITFNDTRVYIEQKDGNIITNDMSDITRIINTYGTGITESLANTEDFLQDVSPDEIAINCVAGSTITIYNINGSQILSIRQLADNGTVSIASLPKGIYLIRANEKTAKFIKR